MQSILSSSWLWYHFSEETLCPLSFNLNPETASCSDILVPCYHKPWRFVNSEDHTNSCHPWTSHFTYIQFLIIIIRHLVPFLYIRTDEAFLTCIWSCSYATVTCCRAHNNRIIPLLSWSCAAHVSNSSIMVPFLCHDYVLHMSKSSRMVLFLCPKQHSSILKYFWGHINSIEWAQQGRFHSVISFSWWQKHSHLRKHCFNPLPTEWDQENSPTFMSVHTT